MIALTMGDAAGIGPEIIVKSLVDHDFSEKGRVVVVGDAKRLREALEITNLKAVVRVISDPDDVSSEARVVHCIDMGLIPENYPFGIVSSLTGDAAYQYVKTAVDLAKRQKIRAICTAPLNKEALHKAGHIYPGHTELLAELTDTAEVSMLLTVPGLRVIHVTTHIGLLDAIEKIDAALVGRTIDRGFETLLGYGLNAPRIGVCGINPHAGENGLFGRNEETEKILPAILEQQKKGRHVEGPLPADTLFFRAVRGDFDLVVAMYHDQGHGPVKVLGIEHGVNVTVGLPFVRTSVDHGTAFDIAGKGVADERSMVTAIQAALDFSVRF